MVNLSLLPDFIIEAVEHLDEMESSLLQLETDPDNMDTLNDIFRSMHTIKGAAQFTGIDRISKLSHVLENLLDLLRTGEKKSNPEIIDALIEAKDRITLLVNELEQSQAEETPIDDLVSLVQALLGDVQENNEKKLPEKKPPEVKTDANGDDHVPNDENLDDENYTEELDEELSAIFIKQLAENILFLKSETDSLAVSKNRAEVLSRCVDSIKSLQSAANYMGYEKLTRHYENWVLKIDDTIKELSEGKDASFDFMSVNIDKIVKVFPKVREAVEQGDYDYDRELDDELEDAFTSIDELEALSEISGPVDGDNLNGNSNDKIDLPPGAPDLEIADESLKDEDYTEKFDEELSGIFIKQLTENISFLQIEINSLVTATNKIEVLSRCADSVKSLQSAANYMGYEKLIRHYKNWLLKIDNAIKGLSAGKDVSFNFMNVHVDEIIKAFPQVREAAGEEIHGREIDDEPEAGLEDDFTSIDELEAMSESSGSGDGIDLPPDIFEDNDESLEIKSDIFDEPIGDEPDISDLLPDIETENEMNAGRDDKELFDKLSDVFDSSTEQIPEQVTNNEPDEDDKMGDKDLFDKLSNAFDSTMEQPADTELEAMNDVLEEMLFSEEEVGSFTRSFSEPEVDAGHQPEEEIPPGFDEPVDQTVSVSDSNQAISEKEKMSVEQALSEQPLPEQSVPTEIVNKEDNLDDVDDRRTPERSIIKRRKSDDTGKKVFRQSVRVDADKIDYLMNQVGELVVSRAYFVQLLNDMKNLQQDMKNTAGIGQKEIKPVRDITFRLAEATVALGRVSNELQEGVMKVRMLPISQLFNRYPRLVRDLVHNSDKNVKLEIKGEDTELDKMVIEEISDPLIHLIRNAVDHGIETIDERKRLGKPETGALILEAYHESNHIVIEVTDDGKGIDPNRIKAKALKKGLFSKEELDRMSTMEVYRIIMMPGFSTSVKTTTTSGRGVGMDVVKKNVEKLNGTIEIESKPGIQTRMRLKIPLTLAIIPALMVRVANELFTIPLSTVEETLRVHEEETSVIEGVEVMHLRNTTMPIFRLVDVFSLNSAEQDDKNFFVVIVSTGMQRVGLIVDELLGQEEVVIKPLEDYLREDSGFSGATIIGDGRISLILDIYELIKMTSAKQARRQQDGAIRRKTKKSRTALAQV